MGREVRRVPKDWQHPKDKEGGYIPLLGYNFSESLQEWEYNNQKWNEGFTDDFKGGWKPIEEDHKHMSYEEYAGPKPLKEDYVPEWKEDELTHIMMYESTSEGTPISPAFETPEELAHWLEDNNASAFANYKATYEQWLHTIKVGYAVSMVFDNGKLQSGVEALY